MRVIKKMDGGAIVQFSARDLENFSGSWPCAGFSHRGVAFEYDRDGDLIDSNDGDNHPRADGGAMAALADDGKRAAFGRD